MKKEIKRILYSMDVKLKRARALEKTQIILKKGPEALKTLVEIGLILNQKAIDDLRTKKVQNAIIFILSHYIENKTKSSIKVSNDSNAVLLLCRLSLQGYRSSNMLLHKFGLSDIDIIKVGLLSLPILKEKYEDLRRSIDDTIEDIKLSKIFSGDKGLRSNCYVLGQDGDYTHKVYRTGENSFAYSIRSDKS
jgi:hypothetical protein